MRIVFRFVSCENALCSDFGVREMACALIKESINKNPSRNSNKTSNRMEKNKNKYILRVNGIRKR